MKFKKRFLMCLAIVGILLVPSMAKADANGAVALNVWLRGSPTDNIVNGADLTATATKVRRHQTLYFVVHRGSPAAGDTIGGVDMATNTLYTLQSGVPVVCTPDHASTGCDSAPLFISSEGALVCADSETGDLATSGTEIDLYICADSTCERTRSFMSSAVLISNATDNCVAVTAAPGGSWIYIDLKTTSGSDGDTALVWITGQ